jgi:hypothetical protein
MKLNRRELAAAFAAAPVVAAAQPAPQGEDLDALARTRLKNNAVALGPVDLPMATEPAFQFKA